MNSTCPYRKFTTHLTSPEEDAKIKVLLAKANFAKEMLVSMAGQENRLSPGNCALTAVILEELILTIKEYTKL